MNVRQRDILCRLFGPDRSNSSRAYSISVSTILKYTSTGRKIIGNTERLFRLSVNRYFGLLQ